MKKIVATLVSALVALGCAQGAAKEKGRDGKELRRQPVYVDSVQAPAEVPADKPFMVTVEGNLPTPAWRIADVEIKKENKTVHVVIWGELFNEGPSIQMLEPFTRKVEVPGLTAGQWTVEVSGHGGTKDEVKVTVQ